MNHALSKTILIDKVIELIAQKSKVSLDMARHSLYNSNVIDLIDDDETGLYGQSPLYIFSLFDEERNKQL